MTDPLTPLLGFNARQQPKCIRSSDGRHKVNSLGITCQWHLWKNKEVSTVFVGLSPSHPPRNLGVIVCLVQYFLDQDFGFNLHHPAQLPCDIAASTPFRSFSASSPSLPPLILLVLLVLILLVLLVLILLVLTLWALIDPALVSLPSPAPPAPPAPSAPHKQSRHLTVRLKHYPILGTFIQAAYLQAPIPPALTAKRPSILQLSSHASPYLFLFFRIRDRPCVVGVRSSPSLVGIVIFQLSHPSILSPGLPPLHLFAVATFPVKPDLTHVYFVSIGSAPFPH
ncbi:uncharacterized protein UTRI_00369 [Ustilago trichophora]|uniref:Uncharacterized protein n=1 Tax=Ustilago trichophora TaxID=86804 RepID=A0A5C3DRX2_9BASI|nr:uncharacterized protein UTRI_00369 [Ustilago trichophora]